MNVPPSQERAKLKFVHLHKYLCDRAWLGVGVEEAVEAGSAHGPEEGPSAIYHLGNALNGYSVEEPAGGFLGHPPGMALPDSQTTVLHHIPTRINLYR